VSAAAPARQNPLGLTWCPKCAEEPSRSVVGKCGWCNGETQPLKAPEHSGSGRSSRGGAACRARGMDAGEPQTFAAEAGRNETGPVEVAVGVAAAPAPTDGGSAEQPAALGSRRNAARGGRRARHKPVRPQEGPPGLPVDDGGPIAAVKAWAGEHGHPPARRDSDDADAGVLPSHVTASRLFGSWADLVEAAGFHARRRHRLRPPPRRHAATREAHWTRERIVDAIKAWAVEHGEPPCSTDWRTRGEGRPTEANARKVFGSWRRRSRPRVPASHSRPPEAGDARRRRGREAARLDQGAADWLAYRTALEAYVAADEIEADGERVARGARVEGARRRPSRQSTRAASSPSGSEQPLEPRKTGRQPSRAETVEPPAAVGDEAVSAGGTDGDAGVVNPDVTSSADVAEVKGEDAQRASAAASSRAHCVPSRYRSAARARRARRSHGRPRRGRRRPLTPRIRHALGELFAAIADELLEVPEC
jgi:hypothetical protein